MKLSSSLSVVLSILTVSTTEAFAPSIVLAPQSPSSIHPKKPFRGSSTTQLQATDASSIFPVLIAGGAVALTLWKSPAPSFEAWKDSGIDTTDLRKMQTSSQTTIEKEEVSTSSVDGEEETEVEAVTTSAVEEPTEEAEETDTPTARTDLLKKVGRTVEQNKEMKELGDQRRREKEEASTATSDSVSDNSTKESTDDKPRKSKRKFALKLAKKVIAPWRKWKNIS